MKERRGGLRTEAPYANFPRVGTKEVREKDSLFNGLVFTKWSS